MRREAGWCHFEHEADIGVCGFGATPAEAFEQAALAMMAVVSDAPVGEAQQVAVSCEAPDLELLLVEWLNALVFEMATQRLMFARFAVRIDGTHLTGDAWGEVVDRARHQPVVEVKGATYTELSVSETENGRWQARCVVDV